MCTVLYLRGLGLLSKNRDKETDEVEEIVNTGNILAVRTEGTRYFSLGMNRHGCAFVSTAVNSPEWTAAIEGGEAVEAKTIMAAETDGSEGPTWLLSDLLPSVKSVDDWMDALMTYDATWRGYNLIMVDKNQAVHVEAYGDSLVPADMGERYIVTNHFRKLDWGAKVPSEYQNSFDRFNYAEEALPGINSCADLFKVVVPTNSPDRERIWRNDTFRTISTTVLDLNGMCLHRCKGPGQPFEKVTMA